MTKQITEITEINEIPKHSITDDIIDGANLHDRIEEDADSATIYTSECWDIVKNANRQETDAASEKMKEVGFEFEDMNSAIMTCAYWIKHTELMNNAIAELKEDLETLQDALEELEELEEPTEEQEKLISDLEDAINKIEENI
ncbi:MAG: hypothetical protein HRU26_11100 [Psychroserpens sp.]|nr:hypothetical protein [Psychroserpens sp.]